MSPVVTSTGKLLRYELQTRVVAVVEFEPTSSDDSQVAQPFTREHVLIADKTTLPPSETLPEIIKKVARGEEA